uniref:Hemimethylated DNA-binding domain-containing protein n=1 Tax=Plectus sambesii TaxID=2011161 RepID=A0A914W0H3_9BILA
MAEHIRDTDADSGRFGPSGACVSLRTLTAGDLARVALVCRSFRRLSLDGLLWRSKFQQKYPTLAKHVVDKDTEWMEVYRQRYCAGRLVKRALHLLAGRYVRREGLLVPYTVMKESLVKDPSFNLVMCIDALRCILNDYDDQRLHRNLTERFYGAQLLSYIIKFYHLRPQVEQWQRLGGTNLIQGVLLFSQWFRPEVELDEAAFESALQELEGKARARLMEKAPTHPLITKLKHWSELTAVDRHAAISAVIYTFQSVGLVGDEDTGNIERSCVDLVLTTKKARPITLCALFHLIADRIGIVTELISFPGRFFLRFVEHADLESDAERYTYVDVWEGGNFRNENALWAWWGGIEKNRDWLSGVDAKKLVYRMLANHRQGGESLKTTVSALEMSVLVEPQELQLRMALARIYCDYMETNYDLAVDLLENSPRPVPTAVGHGGRQGACPFLIQVETYKDQAKSRLATHGIERPENELKVKKRSEMPGVRYAVGMIMRHKKYNYTCVIAGWDDKCAAPRAWQMQMGVQTLQRQGDQPFYNVLADDGSNRYAAEDNMIFEPKPVPISHDEVAKYFCELDSSGQFYRMNEHKAVEYPEDEERVLQYVADHYSPVISDD